jgi:hypothetical protein
MGVEPGAAPSPAQFQLRPGAVLVLGAAKEAWPADVAKFVARELGRDEKQVSARRLGGGFSADSDSIFSVSIGGKAFGTLKVFRDAEGAKSEERMQRRLNAAGLHAPVPYGVATTQTAGGTASGAALLMTTLSGTSLQAELARVPRGNAPGHEAAFSTFRAHVTQVASYLAEFHNKLGSGKALAPGIKENRAAVELHRVAELRGKLPTALVDGMLAKLRAEVIPAYRAAPVKATVSHGDANLGNFLVEGPSVGTVDLVNMEQSLTAGEGHTTAAKDVAYFMWLLRHYGSVPTPWAGNETPPFSAKENDALGSAFLEAYYAGSGEAREVLAPAVKFYRVDRELEAFRLGWDSAERTEPRLRALLGL